MAIWFFLLAVFCRFALAGFGEGVVGVPLSEGIEWNREESQAALPLYSVFCTEDRCVAVGHNGTILVDGNNM